MFDPQLGPKIVSWISRLTGLPEADFAGLSLRRKLELIAQWHAAKMAAEHVTILLCGLLLVEERINERQAGKLVASSEVAGTPLGDFNYVSGLTGCFQEAARVFLPLLEQGAYRPFLRNDTGKAILDLCSEGAATEAGLSAPNVADAILKATLSPNRTRSMLRTLRTLMKRDPQAGPRLLRVLMEVRQNIPESALSADEAASRVIGTLEGDRSPSA